MFLSNILNIKYHIAFNYRFISLITEKLCLTFIYGNLITVIAEFKHLHNFAVFAEKSST